MTGAPITATLLNGLRARDKNIGLETMYVGGGQGLFHTADPKMSALQIFGTCNYAWTWYEPDGSQSAEEIARLFARKILGGLAHTPTEDAALDELITKA
jgi:TetR/AcrR family transcriptional regulator, cholesterol catabolism regulator